MQFGSGKSTLLACVIQFIVRARDLNHHHDATSPSTSAAAASLNAQAGGKRRQAPGGGGGKATAAPPLAQRCRVLVAAHTNVAVDRVLLSLQVCGPCAASLPTRLLTLRCPCVAYGQTTKRSVCT